MARLAIAVGLNGCERVEFDPLALKEQMRRGESNILEFARSCKVGRGCVGEMSGMGGRVEVNRGDGELRGGKKLRMEVCVALISVLVQVY